MCGYLQVLLTSISGPVVLEAASGILSLARVADRVLAAAPILAIAALMDLWDHDSSSASHSQIMDIVCANLDALQACYTSHLSPFLAILAFLTCQAPVLAAVL